MNNTLSYITFPLYIFCFGLLVQSTQAININYIINISINSDVTESNSLYNIEKSKLLEKYINGLLQEIFELKREHAINNRKIDQYVFNLKVMSTSLKNVQSSGVGKREAESTISHVMGELSASKQEIGKLLKQELENSKIAFSKYRKSKAQSANIISSRMLQFANTFSPKVRKMKNNKKKNDILFSIDKIRNAAINLGNFGDRLFSSQSKMNESYNMYVKDIRRELQIIRAIIVSK